MEQTDSELPFPRLPDMRSLPRLFTIASRHKVLSYRSGVQHLVTLVPLAITRLGVSALFALVFQPCQHILNFPDVSHY